MAKRGNGEGSVYKQRNGLWAASISIEGDKRKYFYGKTRKEVQEKLVAALQEQKQGMLVATPQQTVGQFLTDWLEHTHMGSSVYPCTCYRHETGRTVGSQVAGYQFLDRYTSGASHADTGLI